MFATELTIICLLSHFPKKILIFSAVLGACVLHIYESSIPVIYWSKLGLVVRKVDSAIHRIVFFSKVPKIVHLLV